MSACSTYERPVILVVDDDPAIIKLVTHHLRALDVEVSSAADAAAGRAAIARRPPTLVLLDHHLPGENGLDMLRALRETPANEQLPVVMITGSDDRRLLTACFEAGADDYVRKPLCSAELVVRVRRVLELRRLVAALERAALHDQLTGLPNRALLRDRIGRAIARARRRTSEHYAVLFIDFDRFKAVNDALGHEAGDALLRSIAARLDRLVRGSDTVATPGRLGGDEFVVLLEGLANPADAQRVGERVLGALAEAHDIEGRTVICSASVGIVTDDPRYADAAEVLRDADTAMYEAKSLGRGRCVEFAPEMRGRIEQRLLLEEDLRSALALKQLYLVYQPIIDIRRGVVAGYEALMRWRHPQRGVIPPNVFIPLAEESGLIEPMGAWCLDEAARQLAEWRARGVEGLPLSIAVNLSRRQVAAPGVPGLVRAALHRHELPPAALTVEVTETEIVRDIHHVVANLRDLRALGVSVAMDDFGTGYSSLAALHEFPIDILKIDRSFVANIQRGPDVAAVVRTVVGLAATLRLQVVAEGVETEAQLGLMRALGVDRVQGFYFSKPLEAEQARDFRLPPSNMAAV